MHMCEAIIVFEPFYHIDQAVGALIQIRIIDLRGVARENHFCSHRGPGNDSFYDAWRKVLCFVDIYIFKMKTSPARMDYRRHFKLSGLYQSVPRFAVGSILMR